MKSVGEKVKLLFNKNLLFFEDAALNMVGFAIYICSQQILLLPTFAKQLDAADYANIIVLITVMNIFCNVLGGQIGITRQLQGAHYAGNRDAENRDFTLLMVLASLLIMSCFPIMLIVLHNDLASVIFLTITVLIWNYRLYIRYYFCINRKYKQIILQNIGYLLGICCGLLMFSLLNMAWIPLFLGESFALVYTLVVTPKNFSGLRNSVLFRPTVKRYAGLGTADALTNAVALIDKLLVYPLLGAYPLAVYNAGTATSKVIALIISPLNEVILVRLSKAKDKGLGSLLKTIILLSFITSAALFFVLIPVIYGLTSVLYRQYLSDVSSVLLLISLGCAVGSTSSVMKSFILRFSKPQQLTLCYVVNIVILIVGGYVGANYFGLIGFAGSMVVGQVELWLSFVFILRKITMEAGAQSE